MTDELERAIAHCRRLRTELFWEYHRLMQEDPLNTTELDSLAVRRIQATNTLNMLSQRMLKAIEMN